MFYYTVKSIIKYYTGHTTPLYTCFLDTGKAFDRVNHWTLFIQLINSGISLLIVRILVFWYQTQQLCIKWSDSTSCFYNFKWGLTRAILSTKIFALFMNRLTEELSNRYAGCYINDKYINYIMYADDICLMAPIGTEMQNRLDVCHNY